MMMMMMMIMGEMFGNGTLLLSHRYIIAVLRCRNFYASPRALCYHTISVPVPVDSGLHKI